MARIEDEEYEKRKMKTLRLALFISSSSQTEAGAGSKAGRPRLGEPWLSTCGQAEAITIMH
jgi:hypothetical protein